MVGSSHQDNPEHTLFLVGAYARYNWPYVWVRSNLGKFGQGTADKDLPLDLRTTTHWKDKGATRNIKRANLVGGRLQQLLVCFNIGAVMVRWGKRGRERGRLVRVWKAAKGKERHRQDWFLKCLQGGRAHPLAVCGVATLCCSPPASLETETSPGHLMVQLVAECG